MEQAAVLSLSSIDIKFTLALLLFQNQRFEEAVDISEGALSMAPNHRSILMNYSESLSRVDRHNEAINAAQKVIAVDAALPTAWFTLSKAYLGSQNRKEATGALKEGLRLCAPYSMHLVHVGKLCKELNVSRPL